MNPPKKRKMIGFPYWLDTDFISMIPSSGNKSKGRRAVTEIETASVIHQMTIHSATPKTGPISFDSTLAGSKRMHKNNNGPEIHPAIWYLV
jgi:hypothetical protein